MMPIFAYFPFILMFALYGFILWLFYRMVAAVEKISVGIEEIADLVRRNPARPDVPPLTPGGPQ